MNMMIDKATFSNEELSNNNSEVNSYKLEHLYDTFTYFINVVAESKS